MHLIIYFYFLALYSFMIIIFFSLILSMKRCMSMSILYKLIIPTNKVINYKNLLNKVNNNLTHKAI